MPRTENQTLFDTNLTTSMASNDFFETEFDKCLQIIKEAHTTIIKVVEKQYFQLTMLRKWKKCIWKMHKNFCVTHLQKWMGFPQ